MVQALQPGSEGLAADMSPASRLAGVIRAPAPILSPDPDARPASDAFDCFNDDLVFILDALVSRTGGSFGMLSGRVLAEGKTTILALTTDRPAIPAASFTALSELASFAISGDRRRRDDDAPSLQQGSWNATAHHEDAAPRTFRTLQLTFGPAPNVSIVATVCKPDGEKPFGMFEELIANKLYPVISRYARLWWMHRVERRRANTLQSALDISDIGVLTLGRRGDLLFANTRAGVFLQNRDGLFQHHQSIVAEQEHDGVRLQAAIQNALHVNLRGPSESSSPRHSPILQLARRDGRRALIVTVMAVARAAVDIQDPAVIIYVLDPDQNVDQLLAPVCALYRLTAAETRLVIHLVSGLALADAAKKMHIQPETARAYLKQVFSKTQTHRQADLVRIMLSSTTRTRADIDLALI